jgi:putative sterol carrier protein
MSTIRYCTPEWLAASAAGYEANPRYREEFARLKVKLCFRIVAEPKWGIDKDIIFASYVHEGELQKLAFVTEEEAERESDFLMVATPQQWKKLLRKDVKFVTEFMMGRITLEKGSRLGVLQVAPHANTFIDALNPVELQFQDEMTADELATYRAYLEEFRQELGV